MHNTTSNQIKVISDWPENIIPNLSLNQRQQCLFHIIPPLLIELKSTPYWPPFEIFKTLIRRLLYIIVVLKTRIYKSNPFKNTILHLSIKYLIVYFNFILVFNYILTARFESIKVNEY